MERRLLQTFLVIFVIVAVASTAIAQVKNLTIPQLQQVSRDSLLKLDTLQAAAGGQSLQQSPYWHGSDVTGADTVSVTGIVIVKPGVLTYTLARYNIFIQDTTTGQLWGGLNVLTNDTSTQAQSTGITALDSGMIVTITGRLTEYPNSGQNNSLTEMFHYSPSAPVYTSPPTISTGIQIARPLPKEITVDSLAYLKNGSSFPKPSSGEQYESMYVIVRNVTVTSVDPASGRFSFQNAAGNVGYMYDGSKYFTLRGHKLASAHYTPPPVGTVLAYLRGVVLPQSRTGTCGDYTIMPLYPGDLKVSSFSPSITNIQRSPSPPGPSTVVTVSWKVKNLNVGGVIDSSFLAYKIGSAAWAFKKITPTSGDSLYSATIPAATGDSLVSYYVQGYGGGIYGAYPDPSIPNFYQVRGTAGSVLTIHDIEFTPYVNGASGFVGDTVTLNGTIIADTTDIKEITSNRPRLWMASAAGAWNGIPMWGNTVAVGLDTLLRGDSVQVHGIVSNLNGRTNIQVLSCTLIHRGVTVPAPSALAMSAFPYLDYQLSNQPVVGTAKFAQWVGQLVQFNNVYLTRLNADNLASTGTSNFGEYFISEAKLGATEPYGIRVDDNGTNNYYADTTVAYQTSFASGHAFNPPKNSLITLNQKIAYLRGILDMSFSEYKLEPRKNDDYGAITSVLYQEANVVPKSYVLDQNYPNPFNPSTTISYSIPAAGHVSLKIFNLLGQEVETLIDHQQTAGSYKLQFDASRLSTGVYFYQLKADQFVTVKKMLLLK
jgi:hypothetical protein